MLSLAAATPPSWTARALADLDAVMIDHAHCEKKAAGTAVNLIFRYPQHAFLQRPLSALAREELSHFEQVLGHLEARGIALCAQRPAPYAGRLRKEIRTHEPARLVDTLLCCALIEARSCERLKLLGEALEEPALRRFYTGLVASEARHHGIYLELAEQLAPGEVRPRLRALAAHEARVLLEAPPLARLHA
ncbi:MAG: tRNA-(ms[2]io[6]A)-hydroxylase [Myxococcales bacterium]|nr:tRNA-(ms[2]io[6]A)-hydroxylase [Myxococcales bacterium]